MAESPNPGSNEALDLGCLCAVLDNCHGRFAPFPPDDWWITGGCPVHDPDAAELPGQLPLPGTPS